MQKRGRRKEDQYEYKQVKFNLDGKTLTGWRTLRDVGQGMAVFSVSYQGLEYESDDILRRGDAIAIAEVELLSLARKYHAKHGGL